MRGKRRHLIVLTLAVVVVWTYLSLSKGNEYDGRMDVKEDVTAASNQPPAEDSEQFVGVAQVPPPIQVSQNEQNHHVVSSLPQVEDLQIDPVSVPDKQLHYKYLAIRDRLMELENITVQDKYYIPKSQAKNGKFEPTGNQIVLLSACDGPQISPNSNSLTVSMAIENRNEYANLHGYTHHFIDTTKYLTNENRQNHPVWLKVSALRETLDKFPEAEWIWWLDMDAIIMNPQVDLAEHLLHPHVLEQRLTYDRPINSIGDVFTGLVYKSKGQVKISDVDFIFSQDYSGINAGSFFIRRSAFSSYLLTLWDSKPMIANNFNRLEQDAFIYLLTKYKSVYDHTGLVPQRLINSYHSKSKNSFDKYWPGDFTIHFAGKSKTIEYRELWDLYWSVRNTSVLPI